MQDIMTFLTDNILSTQIILFASIFTSLWMTEYFVSLIQLKTKWAHSSTNILLVISALPIQLLFSMMIVWLSTWTSETSWGLIYLFPAHENVWMKYFLMFVVLDFLDYVYHLTMHKMPGLWNFHLVHHTDLEVDVSTVVREHPGETLLRNCFLMLWVFVCGASISVLLLRQLMQTLFNISSHTSLRLPTRLAVPLGWIFVTPNFHQVHHHYLMPHTNSNYGDVFSIWDRLFGTYASLSKEKLVFGLDTHMDIAKNGKYFDILLYPFRRTTSNSAPITGLSSQR